MSPARPRSPETPKTIETPLQRNEDMGDGRSSQTADEDGRFLSAVGTKLETVNGGDAVDSRGQALVIGQSVTDLVFKGIGSVAGWQS